MSKYHIQDYICELYNSLKIIYHIVIIVLDSLCLSVYDAVRDRAATTILHKNTNFFRATKISINMNIIKNRTSELQRNSTKFIFADGIILEPKICELRVRAISKNSGLYA